MPRRVVSFVHHAAAVLRADDPVLEANAFAVAEDIDLAVLLYEDAVELAVAGDPLAPAELAGVPLPMAAAAQDLRGLVESGVEVHVDHAALRRRGITSDDLIAGVRVASDDDIAALLREADALLRW